MHTTKDKAEVISELRTMLADVFAAKQSGRGRAGEASTDGGGDGYARLARAHGYVDGYMRALIELGVAGKEELVELVNAERERSSPSMHVTGSLAGAN